MKRSEGRTLVTHTGSLPRPAALRQMLLDRDDGLAVDQATFELAVKDAVADTIRRQVEAGISVVNDGEMSKITYATYIKNRLSGFEGEQAASGFTSIEAREFPEFTERRTTDPQRFTLRRPACNGPISLKDPQAIQSDIAHLKAATAGAHVDDVFMTAASPGVAAVFLGNEYYKTHEEYVHAIAAAMKPEYEAIAQAGFVLQLDCPDMAMARHMGPNGDKTDAEFLGWVTQNIEAMNEATKDVPREQIRVHLCWGNYEGPHVHDIALKDILPTVLKARAGAISFEASNPRHEHEWIVFRDDAKLPDDLILIPGVIDSTTNFVEHPEVVSQRIIRYTRGVDRERVIAGSDCGFGTAAGWAVVDARVAWAKLAALGEGARLASKKLFK